MTLSIQKAASGDPYDQFYWVDGSATDWKYPWYAGNPSGGNENALCLWEEKDINQINDIPSTDVYWFQIWGCSRGF